LLIADPLFVAVPSPLSEKEREATAQAVEKEKDRDSIEERSDRSTSSTLVTTYDRARGYRGFPGSASNGVIGAIRTHDKQLP
jgi:hypothetical protein